MIRSKGTVVAQALDAVRNGEIISPDRLHDLANIVDRIGSEGVAGIADGTARRAFEEGISKLATNREINEAEIYFLQRSTHAQEHERALGKFVLDLLVKTSAEVQDKKLNEEVQAAFNALASDPNRFSYILWDEEKGIGRRSIASFIAPQVLSEAVFSASNDVRSAISGVFRRRYSDNYKVGLLADDLQWLEEFQEIVGRHLAQTRSATPVGNMHLRDMHKCAKTAISQIEQLNRTTLDSSPKDKPVSLRVHDWSLVNRSRQEISLSCKNTALIGDESRRC